MWSLDWFAAEALAKSTGKYIRRVGWTDRWLSYYRGIWWMVREAGTTVAKATEITDVELLARDWTDEAFNADPCAATPAYNTNPPVYKSWTGDPVFIPPPPPGFTS